MFNDLNQKQQEIINFIREYIQKKGYPPAVREIGEAVGFSSSSTVHNHLSNLEKKGYLRKDPTKPRTIELLIDSDNYNIFHADKIINVPLIGNITAGEPILAEENIEDNIPLPVSFVGRDSVFILRVKGDSMIEAGILDGDNVIVKQQSTAQNGDIVVALFEDEATVKRFYKNEHNIRLQPENPNMEPFIVDDLKILGKVIGVYRRIK